MSYTGFGKSSSGGAASQGGDYFENVTGRSQYERQSWRDSYNDGKAAGDVTGNTNDRLDRERASFQGATWSGSSTQMSALELAQAMGRGGTGPASGQVSTAPGAVQTAGPGVPAAGTKPGGTLTLGPGQLVPTLEPKITEFRVGGITMKPHTGTSNMEEVETRWGDAEFLSPAWFTSWSIAGIDTISNINRMRDEFGQGLIHNIDQAVKNHVNGSYVQPDTPFTSLAGPMSSQW